MPMSIINRQPLKPTEKALRSESKVQYHIFRNSPNFFAAVGGSFGRGGTVFKINPPQNTRGESSQQQEGEEEDESGDNITMEEPTMVGNGATVRGQSLLGNNPTVQGLGLLDKIRKGIRNTVGAGVKATTDIVDAAAPNTVNPTLNVNNNFNGVSVGGLKSNPNLRQTVANQKGSFVAASKAAADSATANVEGQGSFSQVFRDSGPTVQGQGLIQDIIRGTTKIIKSAGDATVEVVDAAGDAAAGVVDAAAPDTVNPTLNINNNINGVNVGR